MSQQIADFINYSNNDYELIVEILCDDEEIGVIKRGKFGLEFILFNHDKNIIIPFDWLLGLMNEANKRFFSKKI